MPTAQSLLWKKNTLCLVFGKAECFQFCNWLCCCLPICLCTLVLFMLFFFFFILSSEARRRGWMLPTISPLSKVIFWTIFLSFEFTSLLRSIHPSIHGSSQCVTVSAILDAKFYFMSCFYEFISSYVSFLFIHMLVQLQQASTLYDDIIYLYLF